jgi:hypothetical protein
MPPYTKEMRLLADAAPEVGEEKLGSSGAILVGVLDAV